MLYDISVKYLDTENVAPTLEEILNFLNGEKNEEDKNILLRNALEIVEKNKVKVIYFKKGDFVRVIEGDLENMIGVVVEIKENLVTVLPKECEVTDFINFEPNQLIKHFKLGDKVIIT